MIQLFYYPISLLYWLGSSVYSLMGWQIDTSVRQSETSHNEHDAAAGSVNQYYQQQLDQKETIIAELQAEIEVFKSGLANVQLEARNQSELYKGQLAQKDRIIATQNTELEEIGSALANVQLEARNQSELYKEQLAQKDRIIAGQNTELEEIGSALANVGRQARSESQRYQEQLDAKDRIIAGQNTELEEIGSALANVGRQAGSESQRYQEQLAEKDRIIAEQNAEKEVLEIGLEYLQCETRVQTQRINQIYPLQKENARLNRQQQQLKTVIEQEKEKLQSANEENSNLKLRVRELEGNASDQRADIWRLYAQNEAEELENAHQLQFRDARSCQLMQQNREAQQHAENLQQQLLRMQQQDQQRSLNTTARELEQETSETPDSESQEKPALHVVPAIPKTLWNARNISIVMPFGMLGIGLALQHSRGVEMNQLFAPMLQQGQNWAKQLFKNTYSCLNIIAPAQAAKKVVENAPVQVTPSAAVYNTSDHPLRPNGPLSEEQRQSLLIFAQAVKGQLNATKELTRSIKNSK